MDHLAHHLQPDVKSLQSPVVSEKLGPYHVQQVESAQGPAWRLAGPGLEGTRAYPWAEAREKLVELARMMNFAWQQSEGKTPGNPSKPGRVDEPGNKG